MTIRNPVEWGADQLREGTHAAETGGHAALGTKGELNSLVPRICRITPGDLREVLAKGFEDFGAYRTDVIFLCVIYPVVGLILAQFAFQRDMFQLLFPLASGFALIGPFAAVGLYEMSRRREQGVTVNWADAFGVLRSPSFGAILALGFILVAIFLLWMFAAQAIYMSTLGPEPPADFSSFVREVFTTSQGWALIVLGVGVGFVFAVVVLAISVVSFPLLLDRKVGVVTAVWTSVRVFMANPGTMAAWGLIIVVGLILGSIPLLVGLAVVMPVLGHATWHLYRKTVAS